MLIATIAKRFTFDAAHSLVNLPPEHKCHRVHGHTYTVELEFTGPVQSGGQEEGFLIDYQVIADAWAPLHEQLDHRDLNGVFNLGVPSTEHLAAWVVRQLADHAAFRWGDLTMLTKVTVFESTSTWCSVRVHDMYHAGVCRHAPSGGGL